MTRRAWALAGVVALAVLLVTTYVWLVPVPRTPAAPPPGDADQVPPPIARLPEPPPAPFVMMRSLIADETYGRIGMAALAAPDGPRFLTSLTCERVFFAAGRGVCLTIGADGVRTVYAAEVFDATFTSRGRVPLTGVPSRVRVSPNGRRAGITVFESGHSYAEHGYSTRTTIIDTTTPALLADLETFAVTREGRPFREVDFNFWGVTFARDSNRFYATLSSGDVKYLVEGNVDARTARVIARDVECPSLSPDNTRVAYKKAFTDARGTGWNLHVLDLASGGDTRLAAETRSVDDQVEWLDEAHVMYHLPSSQGADVWALAVNGQSPPRILVPFAYSPAVVRSDPRSDR